VTVLVTVLLRLRRLRSDLKSAPVDRHHRHPWAGTLRACDDILSHKGKSLMHRDRRVTLVDSLLADLPNWGFANFAETA
jgi:hypothetical protein